MKKFLSLVLALTMVMSLVVVNTSAADFTDDEDITYSEAVDVITAIGVVEGYNDGSFNPTGGLTRGAAAKIICNMILGPTTAAELHADTAPFSDVSINHEFAGYIAYCAKEGIISGYADGSFRPANPLTGYAFMKMLLGALGYDQYTEGYVGDNWSINVAKQAIGIGLNTGLVDEFNGVDYVTREEAALYAFNTLKATLVDYDNTISANVNGAEVVISNNTAKPVTWSEGINEDGNIWRDGFVQFAEEYFPDLVRNDDDTKFMEPANTWLYDRVEIGTYERTDLLVESYTTGVTGREIYDLLKSGVIKDNDLAVYVDGVDNYGTGATEIDKNDLVRSNTDDLANTGNGVLTKVYLDNDKELITIVSINTWLAEAVNDYSEANEYATLRVYNGVTGTTKTATFQNYNVDVEEVANVVDVTDGTFYQVTISKKDVQPNGEIVTLADVEILEDSTISEYSSDNGNDGNAKVTKLTTGGEEYSANEKAFYDDEILYQYDMDLLTDATYNVYLDQYGYFLGVDLFEGTQNYVFITGFDRNTSNLSVKTATAGAIFLDGTMEPIEVNINATDDNIEDAKDEDNHDLFIPWSTDGYADLGDGLQATDSEWAQQGKYGREGIYNLNQWYTYTVNDSGVYTLKPCVRMTWTHYPYNTEDTIIRTDNLYVDDGYDVQGNVYGEDASVFLTVDLDVVDTTNGIQKAITDVTGVYTGVQSVDLVINTKDTEAVDEGQVFTVFDSDGYIIAAVVVGEAQGATGNYAYVLSSAKSEGRVDGEYYYWTFDAILDGEKQTLTARSSYNDTIRNLTVGNVVELRFDGDYVVNVKAVDNDDIYGNQTVTPPYHNQGNINRNLDGEDIYLMKALSDTNNVVSLQRNTLYITENRFDVGLAIARDAKAVVIQDENQKTNVVTNFPDVESAVNYLVDPDSNSPEKEYKGAIMAVLNSSGAAEWVVFDSDTPLLTGSQGPVTGSGKYFTYDASVFSNGIARVVLVADRPDWLNASEATPLDYSFDILVNGNVYTTVSGSATTDIAQTEDKATTIWTNNAWFPLDPSDRVTVGNFKWTNLDEQTYNILYVDQNGRSLASGLLASGISGSVDLTSGTGSIGTIGLNASAFSNAATTNVSYTIVGSHGASPYTNTVGSFTLGTPASSVSVDVDKIVNSTTLADLEDYVRVYINMSGLSDAPETYTVTTATGMDANLAAIIDRYDANTGVDVPGSAALISGLDLGLAEATGLRIDFQNASTPVNGTQKTSGISTGSSVYMNVVLGGSGTFADTNLFNMTVTVTVNGEKYSHTFTSTATSHGFWIDDINANLVVEDVTVSAVKKLAVVQADSSVSADGKTVTLVFNQPVSKTSTAVEASDFTDTGSTWGTDNAITGFRMLNGNTTAELTFRFALPDNAEIAIGSGILGNGLPGNSASADVVTIDATTASGVTTWSISGIA